MADPREIATWIGPRPFLRRALMSLSDYFDYVEVDASLLKELRHRGLVHFYRSHHGLKAQRTELGRQVMAVLMEAGDA